VRATPGTTNHSDLLSWTQRVSDRADIRCRIRYRPAVLTTGAAIPRSVVAYEPYAKLVQNASARPGPAATARRAMQQEDRHPIRRTPALHSRPAPVGNTDHLSHHSPLKLADLPGRARLPGLRREEARER